MAPVIRIGDDTWEMLKIWAVPLEDSADDALRKVLRAANEHRKCLDLAEPLEHSAIAAPTKDLNAAEVPSNSILDSPSIPR